MIKPLEGMISRYQLLQESETFGMSSATVSIRVNITKNSMDINMDVNKDIININININMAINMDKLSYLSYLFW